MGIDAIIGTSGVSLIVLLSLIQISPIKLNPWSALGNVLNKDISDKVDKLQDDITMLDNKTTDIEERAAERDMDQSRARILRFADEIRRHVDHSKEFFDHILDDITLYENYCSSHPRYENEKAIASIRLIRDTYDYCVKEDKFL